MHGRFSMHRRDCVLQSRAVKSTKEPHQSSGDDVIVRFDCGVSGLGSIKPPQHLKSHRPDAVQAIVPAGIHSNPPCTLSIHPLLLIPAV